MTNCDFKTTLIAYLSSKADSGSALLVHHASADRAPLTDIIRHRNKTYAEHGLNYLIAGLGDLDGTPDPIDLRSEHVWVVEDGLIVASLRMTAHPFEIGDVIQLLPALNKVGQGHIEFGRLAISSRNPIAFEQLMATACLYGISHRYTGIVGMCRAVQKRLFERFGLTTVTNEPFLVPARNNGTYWVMETDWNRLSIALSRKYSIKNPQSEALHIA
ncbi:hypothetical protein HQN60_15800 (plasmid) [Deefgea piscis]|uniref:Acyl-homoserine-lactone synthase n=1 Tax=Deefgea piscis TaxID=2739061 RepID=A0A6M8SVW1_9NEIS|nr:hypothetical protein [Deefgea piscis]QKJ68274.1 hypothetical protein HQN60_15800 [Deefgea piscis]